MPAAICRRAPILMITQPSLPFSISCSDDSVGRGCGRQSGSGCGSAGIGATTRRESSIEALSKTPDRSVCGFSEWPFSPWVADLRVSRETTDSSPPFESHHIGRGASLRPGPRAKPAPAVSEGRDCRQGVGKSTLLDTLADRHCRSGTRKVTCRSHRLLVPPQQYPPHPPARRLAGALPVGLDHCLVRRTPAQPDGAFGELGVEPAASVRRSPRRPSSRRPTEKVAA